MVAKGKHRWHKDESSSPSRRVSSEMEKFSSPETPTEAFKWKKTNKVAPTDEEKTASRTVRFNDKPSIHDHIRKLDYSAAEKQTSFWSAADLKGMRDEMKGLVLKFEKGALNAVVEDLEAKIIERYTRKETTQRKRRRKGTVQSLLTHQKYFGGELSERWLTNVYIPETNQSQEAAYVRAIPSEQQHLVAPPANEKIVRHTKPAEQEEGENKPSSLVDETRYLSSILLQVVDYCTNINRL